MKDFIGMLPNLKEDSVNLDIIYGAQDISLESLVITEMMELEAIDNIKIEKIEIINDQDDIDINNHMININYKRKYMDDLKIPKSKYVNDGRYSEIVFTIKVETNLNERTIVKRILVPVEHDDGFYYINGSKMKALWQLVDESTYSQRGRNTLKSRNPIIIYQNKKSSIPDVTGELRHVISYSYALNNKVRKFGNSSKKQKTKLINPLMIYSAKMGFTNCLTFFGVQDYVEISETYQEYELDDKYIFHLDTLFIKVKKELYDTVDMIKSFVGMTYYLKSSVFPLTMELLDDREYWICRIGLIGTTVKSKNILATKSKGLSNLIRIERLVNNITLNNLRLPTFYKQNVYYILYWLITNYDALRKYSNMDMLSKRIRRNEYIVNSSLGKKLSENILKVVEKKNVSKMNTIDTLLEVFNFSSDIIVTNMKKLNDLIKSDDIANDMSFLQSLSFSAKGYQALGNDNDNMISVKYRDLDPSMVGRLDLTTSSNSDVGMSGSFTPFVKLYDGLYFNEEHQPCMTRYEFDKTMYDIKASFDGNKEPYMTFEEHLAYLMENDKLRHLLSLEKIELIEKETPPRRT